MRVLRRVMTVVLALGAVAAIVWWSQRTNWNESLQSSLSRATALKVRPGGLQQLASVPETLLWTEDAPAVAALVRGISIDETKSGSTCCCTGNPILDFYADGRPIATFSFHHGVRLRWRDGKWKGDGVLTESSGTFVRAWLAQRGVGGPAQQYEEGVQYERRRAESIKKELTGMPAAATRPAGE
jgi:hypothetical protein